MGLGKTVQCASFLGALSQTYGVRGPFLIVVPLSTVANWIREFGRWTPFLNAVVYLGDMRSRCAASFGRGFGGLGRGCRRAGGRAREQNDGDGAPPRFLCVSRPALALDISVSPVSPSFPPSPKPLPPHPTPPLPPPKPNSDVIQEFEFTPRGGPRRYKFEALVTTYEIALRDADLLKAVPWVSLMVDEAHRLKNKQSALYQARQRGAAAAAAAVAARTALG